MHTRTYTLDSILQAEKHFRRNFINSLSGFKSANLVSTISPEGATNLAIFTSVVHIGATPPLLGMISRPDSVPRHTLANIQATQHFTLNHVSSDFYPAAHQTAARYRTSEYDATGLTPIFSDRLRAPYVAEAPIQIGLELADIIDIPLNGTKLIIGKILEVRLPETIIAPDGKLDLEAAQVVTASGLDTYHRTQLLARMAYAKPDLPPRELHPDGTPKA